MNIIVNMIYIHIFWYYLSLLVHRMWINLLIYNVMTQMIWDLVYFVCFLILVFYCVGPILLSLNVFCCIGGATTFRLFAYVASPPSFVLYFVFFVVFMMEINLNLVSFYIGPIGSALCKAFSIRQVVMAGAFLTTTAFVAASVSTALWHLYAAFTLAGWYTFVHFMALCKVQNLASSSVYLNQHEINLSWNLPLRNQKIMQLYSIIETINIPI